MSTNTLGRAAWVALALGLVTHNSSWALDGNTRKQLRSDSQADLAASRKAVLSAREAAVRELLDVVNDKGMHQDNVPAVTNAIGLLGDLRAIEAAPRLLELVRFHRSVGMADWVPVFAVPLPTVDPDSVSADYPCVEALIRMRVAPDPVLERIKNTDDVCDCRCCVAVLLGTEGQEVARFVLERAVREAPEPPARPEPVPGPDGLIPVDQIPPPTPRQRLGVAVRMLDKYTADKRPGPPLRRRPPTGTR